MKKVIKGRQLNTQTAKIIGTAMIDADKDIAEALYRTKAGVYFIHNVYRKSSTGELETGEDIYLVTVDDAKKWAAKWLPSVEYNRHFGEDISDETITVTVNISAKAFQTLKHEKELTGDTYGAIISYALGLIK